MNILELIGIHIITIASFPSTPTLTTSWTQNDFQNEGWRLCLARFLKENTRLTALSSLHTDTFAFLMYLNGRREEVVRLRSSKHKRVNKIREEGRECEWVCARELSEINKTICLPAYFSDISRFIKWHSQPLTRNHCCVQILIFKLDFGTFGQFIHLY